MPGFLRFSWDWQNSLMCDKHKKLSKVFPVFSAMESLVFAKSQAYTAAFSFIQWVHKFPLLCPANGYETYTRCIVWDQKALFPLIYPGQQNQKFCWNSKRTKGDLSFLCPVSLVNQAKNNFELKIPSSSSHNLAYHQKLLSGYREIGLHGFKSLKNGL